MKRKRSKRKAVREDRPMLLSHRESQVVELMGKRNALRHSFRQLPDGDGQERWAGRARNGQLCPRRDEALSRSCRVESGEGVLEHQAASAR
jgi:hypothetical protein